MRSRLGLFVVSIMALLGLGAYGRWWQIRRQRQYPPSAKSLLLEPESDFGLEREGSRLVAKWKKTGKASLYLKTSPYAIPREADSVSEEQSFVLENALSQRYWAELRFEDGTRLQTVERIVPLASVPNFRDIGGYKTQDGFQIRWEQVYRASALDTLSEEDSATLEKMGIRLVCDLRTESESAAHPDKVPTGADLLKLPPLSKDNRWLHLGRILFQAGFLENFLLDAYTRVMLDENPQVFRAFFEKLADSENLPLVAHCAIGKDRTGIVIAVLLAFLGVDEAMILADYALSNRYYEFFRDSSSRVMVQLKMIGLTEADFDYLLIADSDFMRQALRHLREKYGSAEVYLRDYLGLSAETLAAVRGNLLE